MDWQVIANAPWIWILGFIQAGIGLFQAGYFLRVGTRVLRERGGYTRSDIVAMVRSALITAIGPVLAEIFVMMALVIAISPGYTWQREGVGVGSVFTELVQASNAAIGAGQEFGEPSFNITGFAATVFVANVTCIGWSLAAALFTRYLGVARERIAGGDVRFLSVITVSSTLGIFGYYAVNEMNKGDGRLVAVIAGAVLSAFLFKLSDWLGRPHLKEWALGIAMFLGMIIAQLLYPVG